MLAAPLAGRWAGQVPPWRLALFGAAAMAVGQMLIGIVGAQPSLPLLFGAMTVQGFGLGLFQVAYFEVATTLIPRQDRGVAGSLVMMTRTFGIVIAATVLTLVFQGLRVAAAGSGATDKDAFVAGFQGTFRITAVIPLLTVACALLRGWTRRGQA
jgi:MFS family permease